MILTFEQIQNIVKTNPNKGMDQQGKTAEYLYRQPKAWHNAMQALADYHKSQKEDLGPEVSCTVGNPIEQYLFNDKNIGKTIRDLPERFTWGELFEIAIGIPTGTQNFFRTYFKPPERNI